MFIYKHAFVLLSCFNYVFAYSILAIIPLPIRSHNMVFEPLFRELALRGHNVTVINNFPSKEPVLNMKFVDLECPIIDPLSSLDFYETTNSAHLPLINLHRQITRGAIFAREECEVLFTSKNIKEHYASGGKYDVIFTEMFTTDCGLAYAGEMYDTPIIGIKSHVLMPTAYEKLGIPFNIAADAYYYSPAGSLPSILHKVHNSILYFLFRTIYTWRLHNEIYNIFDQYTPGNKLNIDRVTKEKMKMLFAYQHFSVTGARLLPPQLLEIGGLHIVKPKPVSADIENFLSNATHGAIYVSFGSILQPQTMSKNKLQQFLDAFKRVPYKIIWKISNMTLPAGFEKVYTSSWMPQLDILCHPKVIGFVSHGGMLSLSESAHCGKPMITVPFFGDQFSNSAAVRESGLGKTLNFYDLNADNFAKSIMDLASKEMQESAQKVSRLWHDRPQSAMDSAIYWTEYVARHGDAPPSLPSKYISWYENWLIDVFSVFILIFLILFLFLYGIFKLIKKVLRILYTKTFSGDKRKRD